jgi:uncharacterized protein (DUF2267 family)
MSNSGLDVFDRACQRAIEWLDALQERMDWDNRHRAYEALGIVLQVLRDRLPVQEAADLGAQFPLLIRGLYYQNWDPSMSPGKYRRAEEFLHHVETGLRHHRMDFVPAQRLVDAVAGLLSEHVSEGELSHIRQSLPAPLRKLFSLEGLSGPPPSEPRWSREQRAWEKHHS